MSLTDVTLCGKTLCSPVIAASGTFGFGGEYAGIVDMKKLGGISGKGLTLEGKYGNEGERLWETPAGLINSIGLQNPGVRHFIEYELPGMKKLGPAVLANLGGSTIETYEEGARLLDETNVDFIELNISCPNVKAGGIAYGVKAESAREVVSRVRACTKKPLIVKLSPNAENITEMALACEAAGADGLSLVNTFQAMAIDLEKRRPVFNNVFAGLSGPAIRPIALRMVYQVCRWGWAALPQPGTRWSSSWPARRPCRWAPPISATRAPAKRSPTASPPGCRATVCAPLRKSAAARRSKPKIHRSDWNKKENPHERCA